MFTTDQQTAIDVRDANVLVSAAAGSGKTSVLVERIIRRITDPDNPIDIDRMLVMTFTNAAAAELRDRIRDAIPSAHERQSILVHNAMITTIHGFCKSIITDHFEKVALDPNFRVADENECALIRADAIEQCIEEAYDRGDPAFLEAAECFSDVRSDKKLAELVIDIYKFVIANPEPEEFLRQCATAYDVASFEEFVSSRAVRYMEENVSRKLVAARDEITKALDMIDENEVLEAYRANVASYKCILDTIDDRVKEEASKPSEERMYYCDIVRSSLSGFAPPAFGRISTKGLDEATLAAKAEVTTLRDNAKSLLASVSAILSFDLKTSFEHQKIAGRQLSALMDLVLEFMRVYEEKKRRDNVIDFNDMEHLALTILKDPDVADIYRQHYEEIYVDEYQDSNLTQDVLVSLICRKDPGNVFCVGDIKQSIYRFRHARPDLFLKKYNTYTEDGPDRRILLNDNFRSRREVVDAVNEVFSRIMKAEVGGIEYDESARLNFGAVYYEVTKTPAEPETTESAAKDPEPEGSEDPSRYKAEIILGIRDELSSEELTANIIAERIVSMVRSRFPVYDKDEEITRPVRFGDFTILVRSLKSFEKVFREVFAAVNIPLSVKGSEGYFGTIEVQTALSFLAAVDNPMNDIPLTALMRSPVGDFTDKDLAVITAAAGKKLCLYDRIVQIAGAWPRETGETVKETGETTGATKPHLLQEFPGIRSKCERLLALLDKYKKMSYYTPVHYLLADFIDNEYSDHVRCMNKGQQRMANLAMLLTKAEDFGKTSFKGLYQFNRYMDQIRKYEIDDGEAATVGENDDVVRLMTMHASKGLEFPVCFIAGAQKRRNNSDESGTVLTNVDHGFGIGFTDLDRRIAGTTLPQLMVKDKNRLDSIAEEMRVLYVAMTRAREKLIIVGTDKEEDFSTKIKSIDGCNSFLDMLKCAHADAGFSHIDISFMTEKDLVEARFEEELEKESIADELLAMVREDVPEVPERPYTSRMCICYPYPISPEIKAKLSVSELKHMAIEEKIAQGETLTDIGERLFTETEPEKYIPAFMRAEGENSTGGTFYGTAFHRIMELWEYNNDNDSYVTDDMIKSFADRMHELHRMDKDMIDAIRPKDVAFFLNSPLGKRMKQARSQNTLFREQPFVIGIPESGETVLVQGIIDAYFIEDDGITIVDYKTDHVSSPEILINRYRAQLEYYGMALNKITGKPIKALTIYSTHLRSEIVIP